MAGGQPDIMVSGEADASTPRRMRRLFAETFPTLPRLDDALLCISEAVTNAVLHARTPIEVIVIDSGAWVRVEVRDGSPLLPEHRMVDETSPTGRGVHLLDRLCSRWGVEVEPAGKTVWLEFDTGRVA